jgi:hypothetical protein
MKYSLRSLMIVLTGTCLILGFVARGRFLLEQGLVHSQMAQVVDKEALIASILARARPPTDFERVFSRVSTSLHQRDPGTASESRATWAWIDLEIHRSGAVFADGFEPPPTPEQEALLEHGCKLQALALAHRKLAKAYQFAAYRPWIIVDETELDALAVPSFRYSHEE